MKATLDLTVHAVRLRASHTVRDPARPTLVFLHDSLGCIALWRDFPDALGAATNCNVLVYDRQGYGQSDPFSDAPRDAGYLEAEVPVLAGVLDQCGIREAILFGHSDGGSIALLAAARYPARIRGLIAEGAHIFVEDITLTGIRQAVEAYQTSSLRKRLAAYHGAKTYAVFQAWAGTWLQDAYRSWTIEAFLPRITCPVLVVQGEEDEYGSEAQVTGIVTRVSGPATPLLVPGVGHTPHKEARDTVLAAAAGFINGLDR